MFGGIERLLVTLARQRSLCPMMEPTFAACFEGQLTSELRETGAAVEVLGAVRASRPWTGWLARRRLKKIIRRGGFDVVLAHACWPLVMLGKAARELPLVLWSHDILKNDNWIETQAARTPPDLIIANSRATAESVKGVFPVTPSRREYYPVAGSEMFDRERVRREVRTELGTTDDAVAIVCTSRLERWKGHSVLVDAMAKLKGEPGWECWVVGGAQRESEKEYLGELKAAAIAGGVEDRVRFLGQRKDVARLLAAADVHCQPNTGPEPFGIAFVEAMYAGLPVVTSGIGGGAELIDSSAGLLTTAGDSADVARALTTLIGDAELRTRLGAGGQARAKALCDPAMTMTKLQALLAGATKGRSAETLVRGEEAVA